MFGHGENNGPWANLPQHRDVYIYKFFSVLGHCIKEVIWLYFTVHVQHCEVYVRKNLDLSELAFLSLQGNGWPSYSLSLLRPSIDNYSTKEHFFFTFLDMEHKCENFHLDFAQELDTQIKLLLWCLCYHSLFGKPWQVEVTDSQAVFE